MDAPDGPFYIMAMAASARTRHLLVALPRDAAEALATLNYTRDCLRKGGDAVRFHHKAPTQPALR